MSLHFAHKIRPFRSSGFEMTVLKQSKIDGERRVYSRTDQYVFITQNSNSCVLGLLGNNTEYSLSSREGHEVSNITLTPGQSRNAAANQLDIF